VTAKTLRPILNDQIEHASYLMTDEGAVYPPIAGEFVGHSTVVHKLDPSGQLGAPIDNERISRDSSSMAWRSRRRATRPIYAVK
jgi:hypothetical protein